MDKTADYTPQSSQDHLLATLIGPSAVRANCSSLTTTGLARADEAAKKAGSKANEEKRMIVVVERERRQLKASLFKRIRHLT
jgi:hypothetical protein